MPRATSPARPRRPAALRQLHPDLPAALDAFLAERGWSWRQLERGVLPFDLDSLTWYLLNRDPVLWAETNLVERPENGGGFWRLFDYQRQSLRLTDADVVNASAAGVGKTREIVVLILWGGINRAGSLLFVGNADGTLDEVWEEISWQRSRNPWLAQQIADTKQKPYRSIKFANGNRLVTRPTGHDGEPLRGVHVHQLVLGDEVAKWSNRRIFDELWRAAEPGCRARLYSVPDGRRDTEFFRIKEGAVPFDAYLAGRRADADDDGRQWVRLTWQKPDMPPPYWTPARRAELVRRYGGEHTSGYRQNVLGLDGEPADSVFPWPQLARCLTDLPSYRVLRLVRDDAQGRIAVRLERPNPLRGTTPAADSALGTEPATPEPLLTEDEHDYPTAAFDLVAAVRRFLRPLPDGHHVAGADFGSSTDPTEIFVFQLLGDRRRLVLRVQLRRFTYVEQRTVIRLLDAELARPTYGWGLDATGVGTAVEHEVRQVVADVSGYVWNATRPARDPETGEEIYDDTPATDGSIHSRPAAPRPRTVPAKEQATQILERLVQQALLDLPYDPDLVAEFSSHTATTSAAGRRQFSKTHDHTVDASRAALLRAFDVDFGTPAPPLVYATPPGSRRPSAALLEDL